MSASTAAVEPEGVALADAANNVPAADRQRSAGPTVDELTRDLAYRIEHGISIPHIIRRYFG